MVPIEYYNYNLQLFIDIESIFWMFSDNFYKKLSILCAILDDHPLFIHSQFTNILFIYHKNILQSRLFFKNSFDKY